MYAGKNMGIMTTLKKNLLQKGGAPEGVIACAPSRGPQRGTPAVGVPRPWGSQRGQGDHGQGGGVLICIKLRWCV